MRTYRPWTILGVALLLIAMPPALLQVILPIHDYAGDGDPQLARLVSADMLGIMQTVAWVAFVPAASAALMLFRSSPALRWASMGVFAWCLCKLAYALAFRHLWPDRVWPP